mmetsp:Transcript_96742/g.273320  ORF Transcript_96742/g.273320 Transcript_96742/m.273320 type:complete len:394 (+) Transcript_96742:72-1253(+)|eukprot:CAMPEP_0117510100 /NCGR_PEP_ID=MMETSP0784-20121206/27817_1 /TAXON_ID=39447 /ORGANISM="" /LENGTH=393 /DNA_ID=CAMNT_0005305729 /DNA_START=70 /DNA_END=1251 /DNA_ORIENTATION=-
MRGSLFVALCYLILRHDVSAHTDTGLRASDSIGGEAPGGVRKVRVILEVDVSRFYAWPPFYSTGSALAVAYLLGNPNVEVVALAVGFADRRPWWLRWVLDTCALATRFVAEVGHKDLPVICGSAGKTFLSDGALEMSIAQLVSPGGDDTATWLSIDSMAAAIAVIRRNAATVVRLREVVALRPEEKVPDSLVPNTADAETTRILTSDEAALSLLLHRSRRGSDPKMVLVERGHASFEFNNEDVSVMRRTCGATRFLNKFVRLGRRNRDGAWFSKVVLKKMRNYFVPELFTRSLLALGEQGISSDDGSGLITAVAAVAPTASGLFQDRCLLFEAWPPGSSSRRWTLSGQCGELRSTSSQQHREIQVRSLMNTSLLVEHVLSALCNLSMQGRTEL